MHSLQTSKPYSFGSRSRNGAGNIANFRPSAFCLRWRNWYRRISTWSSATRNPAGIGERRLLRLTIPCQWRQLLHRLQTMMRLWFTKWTWVSVSSSGRPFDWLIPASDYWCFTFCFKRVIDWWIDWIVITFIRFWPSYFFSRSHSMRPLRDKSGFKFLCIQKTLLLRLKPSPRKRFMTNHGTGKISTTK